MADDSLPSDPDDYVALMVVAAAMDRGVQVTKMLIMETAAACLIFPRTRHQEAASAMTFEKTRQAVLRVIEHTGRQHLIAPDLKVPSPVRTPLRAHERVRLTIPISSGGIPYAKGSAGVIVQPSHPAQAEALAADDEQPVLFDQGGLIAIPSVFLKRESKADADAAD